MLAPDTVLHDRYRITYIVDQQPDAVIYRAIDTQQSLRVLVSELPQVNPQALNDVTLLAGQLVGLSVPGLLSLRDHFAQDSAYYLICDDPGGQDLDRVAHNRGGPLPEAEVLVAVERLLTTLDLLHGQTPPLTLGDLRPTDLWSSIDGGIFLTPFPMVRHLDPEASPYRAPELYNSSAEPTTTSDVYTVGVVLYQLLTGWSPPTAPQRQAGTPLSAPRTLNTRISALAEQLVLRATELKPVNRYQRASEMRSALETVRLMAGRPLGATRPLDTSQEPTPAAAPARPVPPSAEPGTLYGPPPPAPPPTGTYSQAPSQAPVPPQRQRFQLSNGCLIAIVAGLLLTALVICLVGAWIGLILLQQNGVVTLPGGQSLMATTAPTAVSSAVSPDATTTAIIAAGAPFAQSAQLQDASVGAALYSPDGRLIAVGVGGAIELRDSSSLERQVRLEGHDESISALAFSPDGRLLASGAQGDSVIRLWSVDAEALERALEGHTGWIRSLAFSPDGSLLASGSTDQSIIIWEVATGRQLRTLTGHTDFIGNLSFSPDGTTLASASRDGTARLWEVASGQERTGARYRAPDNPSMGAPFWLTGVSFSPDGRTLAIGSISGSLYLLDPTSGRLIRELTGHEGWVVIRGVSFSPDGSLLASASLDGTVRLWNPASGSMQDLLEQSGVQLLGLSWSPDGASLAVTSDVAGSLTIWDVRQREIRQSAILAQGAVTALAYAASGEALVSGGLNGLVKVHLFAEDRDIPLSGGAPTSQYVAFASSNELVAVSETGEVVLIDLSNGSVSRQFEGLDGLALTIDVTRDQRLIAAGNDRGEVAIWERETGALQRTLRGLNGPVFALAFNADGSQIAAASNRSPEQPVVIVWDLQRGEERTSFSGHTAPITAIDMPAGQDAVASSSSDGTLKIWAADSGEELLDLTASAEQRWYSSLAFSPDGKLMATGDLIGQVELWDVVRGERLNGINLEAVGAILGLSFRPDSAQIAAATRDGGVILLDAAVGE